MKHFAWAATDPMMLALPTGGTAQPQGGGTGAQWPKVARERKQTTKQAQSVTNITHSQSWATATAEQRDDNGKSVTKLLREKRRELRSDHRKDKRRREEKDLLPV